MCVSADIWGLCPACERWFRCERWFDRSAPQPVCEQCGAEPVEIENRSFATVQVGLPVQRAAN